MEIALKWFKSGHHPASALCDCVGMPLLSPEEQAAVIVRADAIIEDTQTFVAALAAKLAATRAALKSIVQPISDPHKDR
jgi:hypothetical protein